MLGFGLSDYILKPFKAFFFHANPPHHSLAMIETGRSGIHHIMLELLSLDDVGQAYDIATAKPGRIATTLGRHTNDCMTSFYARTPNEFMLEYGWGRAVDRPQWLAAGRDDLRSEPVGPRPHLAAGRPAGASRAMRAKAAADGQRQPVQVIEGNYEVGVGSCAWWDGVRRGQ